MGVWRALITFVKYRFEGVWGVCHALITFVNHRFGGAFGVWLASITFVIYRFGVALGVLSRTNYICKLSIWGVQKSPSRGVQGVFWELILRPPRIPPYDRELDPGRVRGSSSQVLDPTPPSRAHPQDDVS